jgi:catechol 2,3-dioxygenase-like lactoylglutathione lyase family enzyme
MLSFGHVELFVRDPAASVAFYRDVLGFRLVTVQDGPFAWLQLGPVEVLLRPGAPTSLARYQDAACGLVLYTDDVPAALQALQSRGLKLRGDDGAGCPVFTDPDGHWFQLVDPKKQGG